MFNIKRSYGLVIKLSKGETDWSRFNTFRAKAEPIDKMVSEARKSESAVSPAQAITSYRQALEAVIALNRDDPVAAAHRYESAPMNRLTMLLDKQGQKVEALRAIEMWRSVPDPIGLTKADSNALAKREERLRKTVNAK